MFFVDIDRETASGFKFDMSRFMDFTQNQYDPIWSYFMNEVHKLPYYGSYMIDAEEHRADLLSWNLYQTTRYWWLLLVYNRKICPFDLIRGEYIKYPSLSTIDDFYLTLRDSQNTYNRVLRYI